MLQTKMSKLKVGALLIFVTLFFASRVPRLGTDENNPDGVNWHYRTQQFVQALKSFKLEKTYQHYHPGVTLMWFSGVPVELLKQLSGVSVYDQYNFEAFHFVAKFGLIIVQLALSLLAIFYLSKTLGFWKSFAAIFLVSAEPFFLGNSRIYHMDVLLSLFVLLALSVSYVAMQRKSLMYFVFSGVLFALCFLTKSIGVTAFLYVLGLNALCFLKSKDKKAVFKNMSGLIVSFIVASCLILPAFIKTPVYVFTEIFKEAERVGIRKGHEQIVFGETIMDAGPSFYPLVLVMKPSPFTWAGLILFSALLWKNRKQLDGSFLFLAVYYLGYLVFMFFPTKKIDRYMLPIFPFISLMAIYGFSWAYRLIKNRDFKIVFTTLIIGAFLWFTVQPTISLFPYPFVYTSPLFGSAFAANKIVAQKPFGMGIFDLKNEIIKRYGGYPKLGFYDVKPMQSIYPNSKIFDVRTMGPGSYDLLILAVNEEMPDKIAKSKYTFEKDYSIFINGLEYWRIYVKKIK